MSWRVNHVARAASTSPLCAINDRSMASQTGGPTQLKHLDEQHLQLLGVPSPDRAITL